VLQPANVASAPVANSKHHLLDIAGHAIEIGAIVLVMDNLFSALGHLNSIATELSTCLVEVNFYMEFMISVDSSGASRLEVGGRSIASDVIKGA